MPSEIRSGSPVHTGRVALAVVLCALILSEASAQPGRIGVGAQIGTPGGLTTRIMLRADGSPPTAFSAIVVQASFNLSGNLLVQTHLTHDLPLPDSPIELFVGPGLGGGIDGNDPVLGLGAVAGARFYRRRFEVHFQISPLLHVRPRLDGVMGAGVGLRYFL